MKNCVFCKIVAAELPSVKIYEDELVFAFLDIAPINKGHSLVIPKEHHVSSATIPEHVAGRMMQLGSRIGIAMKRSIDVDGFNLHLADGGCAGQVVFHAHLHVIPRHPEDGFHWGWRQLKYDDESEKELLAAKIQEKLKL